MADAEPKSTQGLPREALVVRGGAVTGESLLRGCAQHPDGHYGFSVQSAANASVVELVTAGGIPHSRVSVSTVGALNDAGRQVVVTSGKGHHATVTVPPDWTRQAADLVATAFQIQENPVRRP